MKFKKEISSSRVALLVFITLISSFAFVSMSKYCFSSAMVFIVAEGHMTTFETGLISSAFWLAYAVSQALGGIVADKIRPEPLITFGLVAAGIINGAIYFSYENYALTLVLWATCALCQFGIWPSIFRIITTAYSGKAQTRVLAISSMITPTAMLASYWVAAIIPRWQLGFTVSGVGLLALAIVWEVVRRGSSEYLDELYLRREADKAAMGASGRERPCGAFKLFLISGFFIVLVVAFFRAIISYMPTLMPSVINSSYSGLDLTATTLMAVLPLFCGVAAPVFGGIISNYAKNELRVAATFFFVMIPVGIVTLFLGKIGYWAIIGAMALLAFFSSSSTLFLSSLVSAKFNLLGFGATAAGLLNAAGALGHVAASALMTFLADTRGWLSSFTVLFILIAASFMLILIAMPVWKRFKNNYCERN